LVEGIYAFSHSSVERLFDASGGLVSVINNVLAAIEQTTRKQWTIAAKTAQTDIY